MANINSIAKRFLLPALLLSPVALGEPANGQVRGEGGAAQVWSAGQTAWVSPEAFWLEFAPTTQGKYWGRSSDYPAYAEVSEHDTLMIEVDGEPCLMYFFHQRWRRAQDVRRWDPAFNELLACPRVFD